MAVWRHFLSKFRMMPVPTETEIPERKSGVAGSSPKSCKVFQNVENFDRTKLKPTKTEVKNTLPDKADIDLYALSLVISEVEALEKEVKYLREQQTNITDMLSMERKARIELQARVARIEYRLRKDDLILERESTKKIRNLQRKNQTIAKEKEAMKADGNSAQEVEAK